MTFQLYALVETKYEVWIAGLAGPSAISRFLMRWLLRYRLPGSAEERKWVSSVWIIQTSKSTFTASRIVTSLTHSILALPSQTSFSRVYSKEDLLRSDSKVDSMELWMRESSGKPS